MSQDVEQLAEQIGRLADAIDELVGSNTQMIDLMYQQLQRDVEEGEGDQGFDGPRYLDEPAPLGQQDGDGE